jgi:hypothetical protein
VGVFARAALVLFVLRAAIAPAFAEPSPADSYVRPAGFTAGVGGGLNVGTPFVEAQLGRRFAGAIHFELYLDYSYDRPISDFAFQTFGIGARTYLFRFARFELLYQAAAGFAVSSSGNAVVGNRTIGDRLLGPVFTQGLGVDAVLHRCWTASLVLSIGDPVWFRPDVAVRYTF